MVELLAVSLVMVVLALLVFPAVARAKHSTLQAGCRSNLRQIGLALQMYADANRDHLPGPVFPLANSSYDLSSTNQLIWFLADTLAAPRPSNKSTIAKLLVCPAQPSGGLGVSSLGSDASYLLNEGRNAELVFEAPPFGSPTPPFAPTLRLNILASTAPLGSKVAMVDADKGNANVTLDGWNSLPYTPVHGAVRNQLYFDWHVAAKRW
jgi:hypothetical protein